MSGRQHLVTDRNHALILGIVAVVAGSYLIHDAYEGRGHKRPWLLSWLPSA